MLPRIDIKVIPHSQQRYDTLGDYFEFDGTVHFRISDLHNGGYEFLILVHELVEWFTTRLAGIKISEIDEFDMRFEADRLKGIYGPNDEPGDDPQAPYHIYHHLAEKVERFLARQLKVDWRFYSKSLNAFGTKKS